MKKQDPLADMNTQLKKSKIELVSLSDEGVGAVVKHRCPTSSIILNYALGGGIPFGRLIEIFGPESNGKTSLAADILANTQKLGGEAYVIDSEQAFEPKRAEAMGVDAKKLIYAKAEGGGITVEDAFETMDKILENKSKKFKTILWDSVAASPTQMELEGEFDAVQQPGVRAKLISRGLRRILGKIDQRTCLIFINQVRSKIGGGPSWGDNNETPGGWGIKFHASVRIKMTRIGQVKVTENGVDKTVGIRCQAQTVKNKTFPPFKKVEFEMLFSGGIDDANALLDLMIEAKLASKAGSYYYFRNNTENKFLRKDFPEQLGALGEAGIELVDRALASL